MRQINLLKDKKRLIRQAVVAWTVLNLGVVLFVIIALSLSSIINNQEQIVIITFVITVIFVIIAHLFFYGRNYYFFKPVPLLLSEKQNKDRLTQQDIQWHKSNLHIFSLREFSSWVLSSLVDGVFLISWVWVQWLVGQVIGSLPLYGIDDWTLLVVQLLFAIATLVPIVAHICVTIIRTVIEAREIIRRDWNTSKNYNNTSITET